MNIDTGEIRPWAALSDEERKSGRWMPLPDKDENGQPISARRRSLLDDMDLPQAQYPAERSDSKGRTYRLNALGQYERSDR